MVRKTRELHKNYIGDIDIGLEANDIESNDKDIGSKANDYWAETQQSNLLSPTNPDLSMMKKVLYKAFYLLYSNGV